MVLQTATAQGIAGLLSELFLSKSCYPMREENAMLSLFIALIVALAVTPPDPF
jgi:hypothetical protein